MCVAIQITGSGFIGAGNNAFRAQQTRKSRLLLPLFDRAVHGPAPSVIEAALEGLIMCGRFTLTADLTLLAERFHFDPAALSYTPSYNIAPSQQILTVMHDDTSNRAGYLRWGLVPSWAKDHSVGHRMINARVETVAEKPSFRQALQRRRCLVLADGFFEWQKHGSTKTPMYMRLHGQPPFAFAGLWDTWHDTTGAPLSTCTILTTTANALLAPIHHRMPVILRPEAEAAWLDRHLTAPEALRALLSPYAPECMEAYAVSPAVNAPRHNAPDCIERINNITFHLEA